MPQDIHENLGFGKASPIPAPWSRSLIGTFLKQDLKVAEGPDPLVPTRWGDHGLWGMETIPEGARKVRFFYLLHDLCEVNVVRI